MSKSKANDYLTRAEHSSRLCKKYERRMQQAGTKRLQKRWSNKAAKHRNRCKRLIGEMWSTGIMPRALSELHAARIHEVC